MLLRTHTAFTFALVTWLATQVTEVPLTVLPWLFLLSLGTNYAIDYFGHERGARAPKTHSPSHAVAVGALVAVAVTIIMYLQHIVSPILWLMVPLGAVSGLSHLLLDLFTEHGIYINGERHWVGGFRYNNPVVNGVALLVAVVLILASLPRILVTV